MLTASRRIPTYNDGWVGVFRTAESRTDFGAERNVRGASQLGSHVVTLAFKESSVRQEDLDFADAHSFQLSLKLRCRRRDDLTPHMKCVVGRKLYDISHIDHSAHESFLYLEEVGDLEPTE